MGKKYTTDEVITALLASSSVTEAARLLGCSTRTVYNYISEDGFGEKMDEARREREQRLSDLMDAATASAISRLTEILEADPTSLMSSVKVSEQLEAARILLATKGASSRLCDK